MRTVRNVLFSRWALPVYGLVIAMSFVYVRFYDLFPASRSLPVLLRSEDEARLTAGGTIDETNKAFVGADRVCLLGSDIPRRGEFAACPETDYGAIALMSGDGCKLYSSNVALESM